MKIFSGNSNITLAKKVCKNLDKELGKAEINKFADGEINVIIKENVRKQDCFIIQSTGPSEFNSPNDNYMELFILIDALKRGSANSITVVMPYYGYERQDRKDYSRAPISARVIATILESLGVTRLITFDLHAGQIQGFFSNKTPVDNLYLESYFIRYIENNIINNFDKKNIAIISPDEGGVKRAVRIANKLCVSTSNIYKERDCINNISNMVLMGNVKGKICIIVDDMIDTAGTACKASDVLINNGAIKVFMIVSHGILSKNAIKNIEKSKFNKVIISNTLTQEHKKLGEKFDIIDISWICGEAMRRSLYGESLQELYDTTFEESVNK
tara:strand:- start:975 stop:1961 length:987 start_codon:yes stop_codon:yes gene_type:complete